jgi:hypothetical protein
MAKSAIIKQLASNEISLEVGLSRLLVIASDIDDGALIQWAESELNGYKENDTVPNYRITGKGHFIYSGINGSFKVTNGPLPALDLGKENEELLSRNCFKENISSIEKYAKSEFGIGMDVSFMADIVYTVLGIQCFNINMSFTPQIFSKMISEVRTKLIKIFIKLDKEFGCLDNLDINVEGKKMDKIMKEIYLIIFQDNSVNVGDKNKIKDSSFNASKR